MLFNVGKNGKRQCFWNYYNRAVNGISRHIPSCLYFHVILLTSTFQLARTFSLALRFLVEGIWRNCYVSIFNFYRFDSNWELWDANKFVFTAPHQSSTLRRVSSNCNNNNGFDDLDLHEKLFMLTASKTTYTVYRYQSQYCHIRNESSHEKCWQNSIRERARDTLISISNKLKWTYMYDLCTTKWTKTFDKMWARVFQIVRIICSG